jgi:hypothetical protein
VTDASRPGLHVLPRPPIMRASPSRHGRQAPAERVSPSAAGSEALGAGGRSDRQHQLIDLVIVGELIAGWAARSEPNHAIRPDHTVWPGRHDGVRAGTGDWHVPCAPGHVLVRVVLTGAVMLPLKGYVVVTGEGHCRSPAGSCHTLNVSPSDSADPSKHNDLSCCSDRSDRVEMGFSCCMRRPTIGGLD